jgi:hypothetical protein
MAPVAKPQNVGNGNAFEGEFQRGYPHFTAERLDPFKPMSARHQCGRSRH